MKRHFLKNLAGDLLTLEINTIVKENTINCSMPGTRRVALLEIAEDYRKLLLEYDLCRRVNGKPFPDTHAPGGWKFERLYWEYAGEFSFNEIRRVARYGVQVFTDKRDALEKSELSERLKEEKRAELADKIALLLRLQRQSMNLIGMFKTRRKMYDLDKHSGTEGFEGYDNFINPPQKDLPEHAPFPSQMGSYVWNNDLSIRDINRVEDLDLPPEQTTLVRKTWEIGVQRVLLQTVIQIDGDITSYLTAPFMEYPKQEREMIMGVHNDSVALATGFWKSLFATLGNIAESVFRIKKKGFFKGKFW